MATVTTSLGYGAAEVTQKGCMIKTRNVKQYTLRKIIYVLKA